VSYPSLNRTQTAARHRRSRRAPPLFVELPLRGLLRPKSTHGELNRGLLLLPDLFPTRIGAAAVESEPRRRGTRRRRPRTPPALPGRRPSPLPRALGPPGNPSRAAARSRRRRASPRPERRAPPLLPACAAALAHARPCALARARPRKPAPPWPRASAAAPPAGPRRRGTPPPRGGLTARRPWPVRAKQRS